jgi:hypothetical protein
MTWYVHFFQHFKNLQTSEQKMKFNETKVVDKNASDETIYKIDVPANR